MDRKCEFTVYFEIAVTHFVTINQGGMHEASLAHVLLPLLDLMPNIQS